MLSSWRTRFVLVLWGRRLDWVRMRLRPLMNGCGNHSHTQLLLWVLRGEGGGGLRLAEQGEGLRRINDSHKTVGRLALQWFYISSCWEMPMIMMWLDFQIKKKFIVRRSVLRRWWRSWISWESIRKSIYRVRRGREDRVLQVDTVRYHFFLELL